MGDNIKLYTLKEAAKLLAISYFKLRHMISKEEIGYVIFPNTGKKKTIRISTENIEMFIKKHGKSGENPIKHVKVIKENTL